MWYISLKCDCCGQPDPRGLMLKAPLWYQIGTKEVYCISCMEDKIGRTIESSDLTNCYGNWLNYELLGDYMPDEEFTF